ncbi:poly(3-hydroxybutyrate) depolymerase-like [Haliotis cracherodii]|uniref:poly(3-hydroxybutyrate) depolymerase-like n=1 Tax=Haliotis cracherodii TaxID=6455 RepID=UPI0039EB8216
MAWSLTGRLVHYLVLGVCCTLLHAVPKLASYNVDTAKVSVSGISSGACMATQYHVVHSREVMGAGIIAGAPFMCSGGLVATAVGTCMKSPSLISVTALEAITSSGAWFGNVDATYHMKNDRVFIFDGTKDSVVNPVAGQKVAQYYGHYMPSSHIKTVFNINAEHGMPTLNYGGACDQLNSKTYLNNCNYSAAFQLLNHIYGGLQAPNSKTQANGQFLQFNQDEFFHLALPSAYSMDSVGYIYVPTGCANKQHKCRLHVAFHGCKMGRMFVGEAYVRHAGYNEVGDLNNIIILYPQVISTATNSQGCWDWFGYTGSLFATNKGFQMTAVRRMVSRVIGSSSSIVG